MQSDKIVVVPRIFAILPQLSAGVPVARNFAKSFKMPRISLRQNYVDHCLSEFDTALEFLSTDDEDVTEQSFELVLQDCMEAYVSPLLPVPKGQDCLVHLLPRYGTSIIPAQCTIIIITLLQR